MSLKLEINQPLREINQPLQTVKLPLDINEVIFNDL